MVADGRGGRRAAGVAHLERGPEVGPVEARRDEPGTERVAGADRVDDHGEREGRPDHDLIRGVARDREGAGRPQLDDRDRRPEIDRRPCQLRRVVIGGEAGQDRQFVRAAEDHVDAGRQPAQDGRGCLVRPQAAAQVQVEADGRAGRAPGLDRARRSPRGRRRRGPA